LLVLTVKKDGSLKIGSATVHVLGISGPRIKLGIEAPRDVPVVRGDAKAA